MVITQNHYDHNALAEIEGTPVVVKEPGVQNVHGISFCGILSKHGEVGGAAVIRTYKSKENHIGLQIQYEIISINKC